jgi:hypothetical protein
MSDVLAKFFDLMLEATVASTEVDDFELDSSDLKSKEKFDALVTTQNEDALALIDFINVHHNELVPLLEEKPVE